MSIEKTILSNLVHNEEYTRKVINFLEEDYFSDASEKSVFTLIKNYFNTHNSNPNKTILAIDLENLELQTEDYRNSTQLITDISSVIDKKGEAWLLAATEKFCKDRGLINAIRESIAIVDTSNNVNQIPSLLTKALGISFNKNIGHDFFEDYEKRYQLYTESVQKVPFSLEYFNKITRNGFANKTLNLFLGPTNSGKSLIMCDFAASNIRNGYNVLYITMEMAEEKIAQRIDANLLDIPLKQFDDMPESVYYNSIKSLKDRYIGKLIVKEYPTGSASTTDFKNLLEELRIKKNFVPHIIYIDYMNICASARMKNTGSNSYGYQKAIAEELRGLAVEYNLPVVSCLQGNRSSMGSSDIDLTNTSDSIGGPMTADIVLGIVVTEELSENNQICIKVLKSRYGDATENNKFLIGIDRGRMKLYDVGQDEQQTLNETLDAVEVKKSIDADFFKNLD